MAMTYAELKTIFENGMLDLSDIESYVIEMERKAYLSMHSYAIYEGKDGFWYTYLPDVTKKYKRKQVRRKTKNEVEDAIVNFYSAITIEEVFKEWNDRQLSMNKIKPATYTRNQQIFDRFYSSFKTKSIKMVSSQEFSEFLEEQLVTFELTARAFSNLKSVTRGFLKRARKRKLITFSVEDMFSDVEVSEKDYKSVVIDDSKEIFYDEEMELIMKYCFEHRYDVNCLGVALMFSTGMRVGEIVTLKHCDLDGDVINVHRTETRYRWNDHMVFEVCEQPKTPAGVRKIIVAEKYMWILQEIAKRGSGDEFIFVSKEKERLHTQAVRKRLYQICEKLNMPVRSPHKARKTYGSILLDSDVKSKIIEKQMGHTSIDCTKKYYYRDRSLLEEKRQAINSVPMFKLNDI